MALILIALALIAAYSLGMWLLWAYRAFVFRAGYDERQLDTIATFTFRLGLCGTLALGFLGLILKG